jgi:glutamine synthetase
MPSLGDTAKKQRIKYFLISFLDLFGTMRAKIVPAGAIDAVAKSGAGFAGFATWFDMTPADPDILAMPDPGSLIQLPWKPEVAWVAADLVMGGKEVAQNPRQVLKRVVATAAKEGYELKSGVECEYFMITPDGKSISDAADQQSKPCYDQQALMRRYDVVAEICDAMTVIGWKPYQNDHEDANGQFEMNWEYDSALRTADRHARSPRSTECVRPSCQSLSSISLAAAAMCTLRCGQPRPRRMSSMTRRTNSAFHGSPIISSEVSCIRRKHCARSPIRR